VTPEHRDPEDGMTDQEAANALFDAVMEGRGRVTMTLEELRKEYQRTTLELSVPFDVPVREAEAREFLAGIRNYVELNHNLIHALEQRVAEAESERDEVRRERDWMYEWFDNLYPRDVDLCLERYRAAHPEAER